MEKSDREIEELVQIILELLGNHDDEFNAVQVRHDELVDILKITLEEALWLRSCNRLFDPNPGFLSTSRRRLVQFLRFEDTWKKFQVSSDLSDYVCYNLSQGVQLSTEIANDIFDMTQMLSTVKPLTIKLAKTKLRKMISFLN